MIMRTILLLCCVIFFYGCKKDLTSETDITQYSWKVKRITVDGAKSKAPKKDRNGNEMTKTENPLILNFRSDSIFDLNLSINYGQGDYYIPQRGVISINSYVNTKVCCDTDFGDDLGDVIVTSWTYEVLGETLLLTADNNEIKFNKE